MKKSYLLFGSIILIVSAAVILKYFQVIASEGKSENKENTTLFSPAEILAVMHNYTNDVIAGECSERKFYLFADGFDGRKNYRYYHDGSTRNSSRYSYEETAKKEMKELITFSDTAQNFTYTIKSKKAYMGFISYLLANKQQVLPIENRLPQFSKRDHYLFNDCVFIDEGFSLKFDGFSILAIPKSEFYTKSN